jgi:preprotein translocase subunit SecD
MKTKYITLILFLTLIFFCSILTFPTGFNKVVRTINEKLSLNLPHLEERGFVFGLDLQGGAYLLYQADFEGVPAGERLQRMEGLRDLIERRVNLYGIAESSVQIRGERLVVEIPGAHDLDRAIDIIGETPFLDFREISSETVELQEEKLKEVALYFGKEVADITVQDLLTLEETEIEGWEIIFEDPYKVTNLNGRHLENARVSMHPVTQEPLILLTFNKEGAKLFEEITARNVGKPVATFLDGTLLQEATVQEKISGGEAQITGGFSIEEAYNVARDLRIGALPVPIELISQQSIGPALGEDSLSVSLRAGMLGMLFVAAFMIFVYRLPGLLSVFSLLTYIVFIVFLFKIIPVTLTLSGIAGFILSIGMAIDANILIIARMREEMKEGKSVLKSIEEGYKRAWSSIRDGNVTTLMVAIILFFITTSFVRGFAVTLILGILVSLFCAMVINRLFLSFFEEGKVSKIKDLWL